MACFTLAVFGLALIFTAPASSVTRLVSLPPQVVALQGRLWQGRALLSGGLALDWRMRPASLLRGALSADLRLTGPQTLASGTIEARPNRAALRALSGRVGPESLRLIDADGLSCTMLARLDDVAVSRSRAGDTAASGTVSLPTGRCSNRVASDVAIPALTVALSDSAGTATARITTSATELGVVRIGPDLVYLRLEPAGARLIPGMPNSAATELELPLRF